MRPKEGLKSALLITKVGRDSMDLDEASHFSAGDAEGVSRSGNGLDHKIVCYGSSEILAAVVNSSVISVGWFILKSFTNLTILPSLLSFK